mgnify:CR=1 FL=1
MNRTTLVFLLFSLVIFLSCTAQSEQEKIAFILNQQLSDNRGFSLIDTMYQQEAPLAYIINPGLFTEKSVPFTIDSPTYVQIYAVGETIYNLSGAEKRYYLKSDDIELYFQAGSESKRFHFTMADRKKSEQYGNKFRWKIEDPHYHTQISIPWENISSVPPVIGQVLGFDAVIGDNDDGFIQKARIALNRTNDNQNPNAPSYGTIKLGPSIYPSNYAVPQDTLFAVHLSPGIGKTINRNLWQKTPKYEINNLIYGFVKDRYDLAATISSAWDNEYLYFLFEITDSRIKRIFPDVMDERGIFVDYGWIEDQKGDRIWEMDARFSKWAGGAYKNQMTDTLIRLQPGTYALKYVSDESHAYGRWNDSPPETPFYGILLYKDFLK